MSETPNLGLGECPGDGVYMLAQFMFVPPDAVESPGDHTHHHQVNSESAVSLVGELSRGLIMLFPLSPLEGR